MKPKYMLIKPKRLDKNLDSFFVIERLSGGYISGRATITKFNILYPENVDPKTRRFLNFEIKGDGRSRKGTLYKKERLHDHLGGVIADLFEGKYGT